MVLFRHYGDAKIECKIYISGIICDPVVAREYIF